MQVEVEQDAEGKDKEKAANAEEEQDTEKKTVIVDEHKGHYVKALNLVINQAESEKHKLKD